MRKHHEKPIIQGNKKQCTKCKNLKNFSEFHKYGRSPDGHKHYCKQCVKEYDDIEHDSKRVFARKNKGELIHCRRCEQYLPKSSFWGKSTYCKVCKDSLGHAYNLKNFGITRDQYVELEKSQNGLCAVCGKPETTRKRLAIDHDHSCCSTTRNEKKTCGKCIRGLVCFRCNTALGMVNDDIDILRSMIKYLSS